MNLSIVFQFNSSSIYFFEHNSLSKVGFLLTAILSKLFNLLLSKSIYWSLNTVDKSRLFPLFPCKLSTSDLVGNSIRVFGDVKVELGIIESCSSSFNFSSGSNPNNDDSFTL